MFTKSQFFTTVFAAPALLGAYYFCTGALLAAIMLWVCASGALLGILAAQRQGLL